MSRRNNLGTCHICGYEGNLSFEHVPPRAAFNDKPISKIAFQQMINKDLDAPKKGKIQQKGSGGYTLCEKCNNDTGSWYADDFVDWCFQGMLLLVRSKGSTSLHYPYYIFPLRVIKQIVTMFFSVNNSQFRLIYPDLVKFVLDREKKYLPSNIKVYCGLMKGEYARSSGISVQGGVSSSGITWNTISEIAFPPFVYVMTFNSNPPDKRLIDITWFSRYEYNEFSILYPKFNVLPVNYFLPGDYRTKEQMMEDYRRNKLAEDDLKA